jgi:hypothetical protein
LYGASPLHLLAHLALVPLCIWGLLEMLTILSPVGARRAAIWLVGCVVLHDLVVLPLYTGGDRTARAALGGAINYVRIPVALSVLMLVVFFGTIAEKGEGAYHAVSGRDYEGYAGRWLLVSAALFAAAGLLYLLRRGSAGRHPRGR